MPSKFPRAGRVTAAPARASAHAFFWESRASTAEITRIPVRNTVLPAPDFSPAEGTNPPRAPTEELE